MGSPVEESSQKRSHYWRGHFLADLAQKRTDAVVYLFHVAMLIMLAHNISAEVSITSMVANGHHMIDITQWFPYWCLVFSLGRL